jgi:hypothetical protein
MSRTRTRNDQCGFSGDLVTDGVVFPAAGCARECQR